MDEVKVIQVIYCTKHRRGSGIKNDPVRVIPEVFSLQGEKIMENDSERLFTVKDLYDFSRFLSNSGRDALEYFEEYLKIHSIDQR